MCQRRTAPALPLEPPSWGSSHQTGALGGQQSWGNLATDDEEARRRRLAAVVGEDPVGAARDGRHAHLVFAAGVELLRRGAGFAAEAQAERVAEAARHHRRRRSRGAVFVGGERGTLAYQRDEVPVA